MNNAVADLRQAFSEAANPLNAAPMAAYMKGIAPFFGIKSPERKVMERAFFAATRSMPFEEVYPEYPAPCLSSRSVSCTMRACNGCTAGEKNLLQKQARSSAR